MRFALVLFGWVFFAGAVAAQDARGLWQTENEGEGYLEVRVFSCGSALCGDIVTAHGPDGSVGEYPHLGRRMIWDMRADGATSWSGGKIWDPRRDRAFNSKMSLDGNVLSVSGCFLGVCQSQRWTRVK